MDQHDLLSLDERLALLDAYLRANSDRHLYFLACVAVQRLELEPYECHPVFRRVLGVGDRELANRLVMARCSESAEWGSWAYGDMPCSDDELAAWIAAQNSAAKRLRLKQLRSGT